MLITTKKELHLSKITNTYKTIILINNLNRMTDIYTKVNDNKQYFLHTQFYKDNNYSPKYKDVIQDTLIIPVLERLLSKDYILYVTKYNNTLEVEYISKRQYLKQYFENNSGYNIDNVNLSQFGYITFKLSDNKKRGYKTDYKYTYIIEATNVKFIKTHTNLYTECRDLVQKIQNDYNAYFCYGRN